MFLIFMYLFQPCKIIRSLFLTDQKIIKNQGNQLFKMQGILHHELQVKYKQQALQLQQLED